jgi:hypothetical protein
MYCYFPQSYSRKVERSYQTLLEDINNTLSEKHILLSSTDFSQRKPSTDNYTEPVKASVFTSGDEPRLTKLKNARQYKYLN